MLDPVSVLKEFFAAPGEVACLAIVVQAGRGPVRAGAKAFYDDAGARRGGDAAFSDELERQIGMKAAAAVATGECALIDARDDACGAALKVYLEPKRTKELLVLGRGAVASAVARVGEACGFRVRSVAGEFAKLDAPAKSVHVVVATGHEADEEALTAALGGSPASVQLVASTRRVPLVLDALRKARVSEEKLALIRSPAGLDLGGDAPEEIALSIVAEIQALRRGGSGRPLSEVKGGRSPKRLPVLEASEPATPAPVASGRPPRGPAPPRPTGKHKVKFDIEDADEPRFPTRHDEDFRPDDEAPAGRADAEPPRAAAKSDRATRKTKRRGDED